MHTIHTLSTYIKKKMKVIVTSWISTAYEIVINKPFADAIAYLKAVIFTNHLRWYSTTYDIYNGFRVSECLHKATSQPLQEVDIWVGLLVFTSYPQPIQSILVIFDFLRCA